MPRRTINRDNAQPGLVRHLTDTENSFRAELRRLDPTADCEVIAAADLGVPYDAIRLGGGFATGCFIQWDCNIPVVPIDITMNIDTSSIFWVEDTAEEYFTEFNLNRVRNLMESCTEYKWNLDASNHFISLTRDNETGRLAIIVHSNEKEFKNQYNGLYPTPGNWFESDIHVSADGRIRLIIGRPAEIFAESALMLESYNVVRHRFVVHELLQGRADVLRESHSHHYYMPSRTSAALGCYVVPPESRVPIFSKFGQPIMVFQASSGGPNVVQLLGEPHCVVPHGWGMSTKTPLKLSVRATELEFQGRIYRREPGVSLLTDPDVVVRDFGTPESFMKAIANACPGRQVGIFTQLRSLTRFGFQQHP